MVHLSRIQLEGEAGNGGSWIPAFLVSTAMHVAVAGTGLVFAQFGGETAGPVPLEIELVNRVQGDRMQFIEEEPEPREELPEMEEPAVPPPAEISPPSPVYVSIEPLPVPRWQGEPPRESEEEPVEQKPDLFDRLRDRFEHRWVEAVPPEEPVEEPVPEEEPSVAGNAPVTVVEPVEREGLNPKPAYPSIARRNGWEGEVLVELRVSENGRVLDARVVESSGFPVLDRQAVDALSKWRFHPGTRGGTPFETSVMIPVRFQLR